jgi:sulfite reductase alpha subunit-like flavoprotein
MRDIKQIVTFLVASLSDNMNSHVIEDSSSCNPLILYATETGTAQDVADRIARQCRRMHTKARLLNMANYSPVMFPSSFFFIQPGFILYVNICL